MRVTRCLNPAHIKRTRRVVASLLLVVFNLVATVAPSAAALTALPPTSVAPVAPIAGSVAPVSPVQISPTLGAAHTIGTASTLNTANALRAQPGKAGTLPSLSTTLRSSKSSDGVRLGSTLNGVHLGATAADVIAALGAPAWSVHPNGMTVWRYEADHGNAWFLVSFMGANVSALQYFARANHHSSVATPNGLVLGAHAANMTAAVAGLKQDAGHGTYVGAGAYPGELTFIALNNAQNLTRFGIASSKFYGLDGYIAIGDVGNTPDRPISVADVGGVTTALRAAYLTRYACTGGNAAVIRATDAHGIVGGMRAYDRVEYSCAHERTRLYAYFAPSDAIAAASIVMPQATMYSAGRAQSSTTVRSFSAIAPQVRLPAAAVSRNKPTQPPSYIPEIAKTALARHIVHRSAHDRSVKDATPPSDVWISSIIGSPSSAPNSAREVLPDGALSNVGFNVGLNINPNDPIDTVSLVYGTGPGYAALYCAHDGLAVTATCTSSITSSSTMQAKARRALSTTTRQLRDTAAQQVNISGCWQAGGAGFSSGEAVGGGWRCSFNAGDQFVTPEIYIWRFENILPGEVCPLTAAPTIYEYPGYAFPGLDIYIAADEAIPDTNCVQLDGLQVGFNMAGSQDQANSGLMQMFPSRDFALCGPDETNCAGGNEIYGLFGIGAIRVPTAGPPGKYCAVAVAHHSSSDTNSVSPVGCFDQATAHRNLPQRDNNPPCGCGPGQPIDVTSGDLYYDADDFALSGPNGMHYSRHYDSSFATPRSNVGSGWTDTYDAYLDLSNYNFIGEVSYVDDHDRRSEFIMSTSSTDYDNNTGDTLTHNGDGSYTLVTWDNRTMTFDRGGHLQSITDRAGNTQTIHRDPYGDVSSVVDALGRTLTFTTDNNARPVSITSNPAGISVTMTYDSGTDCYTGELCSVKESDGSVWTYHYLDPSTVTPTQDLLTAVIDPKGNIEEANTYAQETINGDTYYAVTQQSIQGGKETLNLSYADGTNGGAPSTTIVDGLGRTTSYTYDPLLRQMLSINGPLCKCDGNSLAFTYDAFGRVTSRIEGTGNVNVHTYTYGADAIYTAPDNSTYVTAAYPQITSETVQQSASQSVTYNNTYYPVGDPRQDLINVTTRPSVDTAGNVATTTMNYDTSGNLLSTARSGFVNGSPTTLTDYSTFDSRGRQLTYKTPRTDVNAKTTWTYFSDSDPDMARRGQLSSVTDALGHVTSFANGGGSSNTYSIYGTPLSATDPNGVRATQTVDALGRITSSTLLGVPGDTKNLATSYTYDLASNLIKVKKPLGNAIGFSYNAEELPAKLTMLDAQAAQHDQLTTNYDAMDQISSRLWQSCASPASSCGSWNTTRNETYGYTQNGKLGTITYPTGGSTKYTYDGFGNRQTVRNGDNSYAYTTTDGYDFLHRKTSTALSASDTTVMSYDTDSNVVAVKQNASNILTTYHHDDFGRETKAISPITGTTTYAYDGDDNLTNTVDAIGNTTARSFDALDRQLTSVSSRSGVPTETTTWAYDSSAAGAYGIGRLAKMTDPTGSTTYAYERRGMPTTQTKVVGSSTYVTKSVYDGNGNETQRTLPSGRVLAYSYDYADRPSGVIGTLAGTTTPYVSSATYLPFGPITHIGFGNGTVQQRSYDTRYQPAEISLTGSAGTLSDIAYTNNAAGFVTAETDRLNAGYNRGYTYGGKSTIALTGATTGSALWGNATYTDSNDEKLTTINFPTHPTLLAYNSANQPTRATNTVTNTASAITYNANGDETAYGSAKYAYSARDFLASGDGLSYTYDGSGERTTATASSGKRVSLYDNSQELQSESGLANGSIAYDYIWLAGLPVAQSDIGGQTHWTATDHLGTPFLQTDTTGKAYWQADYEPYGSVFALRTPDVHQPLRFPGQEAEEFNVGNANGSTFRFYNQARWYRPAIGRYTQADVLEFLGDPHDSYAYSANNSINYSDPSGLKVVVEYHTIPDLPGFFYHAYLRLIPDHPKDFCGRRRFTHKGGQLQTTISGEPEGSAPEFGNLVSKPNADIDSAELYATEIPAPVGMSDTDFINALINADQAYPNSIPYDPSGGLSGSGQNSNSYAIGVIQAVEGSNFSLSVPHITPGASNPVAPSYFGPSGTGQPTTGNWYNLK